LKLRLRLTHVAQHFRSARDCLATSGKDGADVTCAGERRAPCGCALEQGRFDQDRVCTDKRG
jgi:hypothetical protein